MVLRCLHEVHTMFPEAVCPLNYHRVLAVAQYFTKTYMLWCLAAAISHMFQIWKCFSASECLHVTGLKGSQTWTKLHRAGATTGITSSPSCLGLLVSGIHVLGCSSAISLSFGVNISLPCKDSSVMALSSPQKNSPGETIHSARRICFPNLTSYKSVKAMLFVHISLERKKWISCNNVSCIM